MDLARWTALSLGLSIVSAAAARAQPAAVWAGANDNPNTLITGVFGMNVGGLPWLDDPRGFSHLMVIMVFALALAVALISRTRMR